MPASPSVGHAALADTTPDPVPVASASKERTLLDAGFRYAMSLRCSQEDAEDLVQEAWFRLLRRYGEVRDRAQLFRTIRNLFVDQYRRERVLVVEVFDDAIASDGTDSTAMPDVSLLGRDLAKPLSQLRPEEREALFLSVVEQYTTTEIAALTGRPRGTVLSLAHRARLKLRKWIGTSA